MVTATQGINYVGMLASPLTIPLLEVGNVGHAEMTHSDNVRGNGEDDG